MNIVNVGYASTNYYVLGASTNRLLVDVGWPGTLPRLLEGNGPAGGPAAQEMTKGEVG